MEYDEQAIDGLRERVIGCAITVHRALGPGLLESTYRECLMIEFRACGLHAEQEKIVSLTYRGERVATPLRIDIVVEGQLVVELKAVDRVHPVHASQVITYLKLSGLPCALLINFNVSVLRTGIKRLEHPDLYQAGRHMRVLGK